MLSLVAVAIFVHSRYMREQPPWLPAVVALLLVVPVAQHLKRQFTKLVFTGDKIRYEAGTLSKTTRTIQAPKVQDVRVDQTLVQRMLRIGNLSIETAGESSRLTVANIDSPQAIADRIIDAAHPAHGQASGSAQA